MELDELRKRLLLRSRSAEILPLAHPVGIPESALSAEARPSQVHLVEPAVTPQSPPETIAEKSDSENPVAEAPGARTMKASANAEEPISILANTVDHLFEPTEAFRAQFIELSKLLQPIDTATQSTEDARQRIADLYEHLSGLASAFQSVKVFAEQVRVMSATFEPMKGLHDQLSKLIDAFYTNVKELGVALEPVRSFQAKVRQLGSTLDSINHLEDQLLQLAEAFRPGTEKPAREDQAA